MDYRNFSPGKIYVDESLQPQGPRRLKTSTPRGRRPNPYRFQNSPDGGFGNSESPPSEGHWNKTWRRSNDSWKSRDSSRNSSFNSTFNSPGGPGQRYQGFRREQDCNTSGTRNIASYYHPSMIEDPWHHLEDNSVSESVRGSSFNAESDGSVEEDKAGDNSDREAHSPDVIVESESIIECSPDVSKDETSLSDNSSSQKSAC